MTRDQTEMVWVDFEIDSFLCRTFCLEVFQTIKISDKLLSEILIGQNIRVQNLTMLEILSRPYFFLLFSALTKVSQQSTMQIEEYAELPRMTKIGHKKAKMALSSIFLTGIFFDHFSYSLRLVHSEVRF